MGGARYDHGTLDHDRVLGASQALTFLFAISPTLNVAMGRSEYHDLKRRRG